MPRVSLNYLVAFLGLILSISSYVLFKKFGFPDKICWGGAILAIFVVTIFWSGVMLGADDDDE